MGTTANMWLYDSQGSWVKGNSFIRDREDSIELLSIDHSIHAPFDSETGKNTGLRKHLPFSIMKRLDRASPFFNKACCNGETIKSLEIFLYKIDEYGKEIPYYKYYLEGVKITSVTPIIHCSSDAPDSENVSFIYRKIRWEYIDGNYSHEDSWDKR